MTSSASTLVGEFALESRTDALRAYVVRQRWFGRHERKLSNLVIDDVAIVSDLEPIVLFLVLRVEYEEGGDDRFSVPLGIRHPLPNEATEAGFVQPAFVIDTMPDGRLVVDAIADPVSMVGVWEALQGQATIPTRLGTLECISNGPGPGLSPDVMRPVATEQTNSSVICADAEFLKCVRRIEPGPSVELEMTDALVNAGFTRIPPQIGGIDYSPAGVEKTRIAFLQRFVDAEEGWRLAVASVRDVLDFTVEAGRLGEVTAEMHRALASDAMPPHMKAMPVGPDQVRHWSTVMQDEINQLLALEDPRVAVLRERRDALVEPVVAITRLESWGMATRLHGDYHLGQVVRTLSGWLVIDFEGEPSRSHAGRRSLWSPLRDVAGMMRSFDYAAGATTAVTGRVVPNSEEWSAKCRAAFWTSYLGATSDSRLLPNAADALVLRRAFEVQKAIYEVRYELGHRPAWVSIPLDFLTEPAQ